MTPTRIIALEEHFTSPKLCAECGEKDRPFKVSSMTSVDCARSRD
jgi:hypothetical protein